MKSRILLVFGLGAALACAWPALKFVHAFRSERAVLHPMVGVVPLPEDSVALNLRAFTIQNGAERIAMWYAPPKTGGTVVLCSGTSSTRASLLPEARALIDAGHGVVLFDWPGHGESTGEVDLGEKARGALRAVLNEVFAAGPDFHGIDPGRVGVFAISYGGVTAVPVVARDPRVRAMVVAATPMDPWEQTKYETRRFGWFSTQGSLWFWRSRGQRFEGQRLAPVARQLAPRPVLVIAGDADAVVDPADAATLVRLIGTTAELWRIPGAGHGGYGAAASNYGTRLAGFYSRTLASVHAAMGLR